MGPLIGDFRFNMEAHTVTKWVRCFLECLVKVLIERWPAKKALEMPNMPWLSVDKRILKHREIAMLDWIHCVNPNPPKW